MAGPSAGCHTAATAHAAAHVRLDRAPIMANRPDIPVFSRSA
jgi:hypothetical protein